MPLTAVICVFQRRATTTPVSRESTACNSPARSTVVYAPLHHLLVDDYARLATIAPIARVLRMYRLPQLGPGRQPTCARSAADDLQRPELFDRRALCCLVASCSPTSAGAVQRLRQSAALYRRHALTLVLFYGKRASGHPPQPTCSNSVQPLGLIRYVRVDRTFVRGSSSHSDSVIICDQRRSLVTALC